MAKATVAGVTNKPMNCPPALYVSNGVPVTNKMRMTIIIANTSGVNNGFFGHFAFNRAASR